MNLRLLHREDIDSVKWDACILAADNGMTYAKSGYLNLMTDNWCGVVGDDYHAVLPVPFRKKWGIRYVYQPAFVQQLGMIGNYTPDDLKAALQMVTGRFPYGNLPLNYQNVISEMRTGKNFILHLDKPYDELYKNFTYQVRKTTKGETDPALQFSGSAPAKEIIRRYRQLYGSRFTHVPERSYEGLIRYAEANPDRIITREVRLHNQFLSAILLLRDAKRLYLVVSVTTDEGRKLKVNRLLVTQLIREFANSGMILDFEGSDLPGVAEYYEGYGAIDQPYGSYNWNNLPFPLRLFKR